MPTNEKDALARLARSSRGGIIDLPTAARALQVPTREASIRISRLLRKGWLRRAQRGLFLVLPLEAEPNKPAVPEDPWLVAASAFAPCYIGGWSAAEYWGLTEQIFRSTLVVTAASVRSKMKNLLGQEFRLFKVPRDRIDVSTTVWRGTDRVAVSTRERTLSDSLRNPEICGGVRVVISIMSECLTSKEFSRPELVRELDSAGSGAAWKRLGFLLEQLWPSEGDLIARARISTSKGNVSLDPAVKSRGRLSKKWGLWINIDVSRND